MMTTSVSPAVPDPLTFACEALAARGALVELAGAEAMALLPAELAAELAASEELRLVGTAASQPGWTPCGMGTPLLERLVADERSRIAVTSVRVDLERPRESQARAAAERFAVRNGLCDVMGINIGEGVYLSAAIAYVVEADDRHEGLLTLALDSSNGAVPDEHFASWLDPRRVHSRLVPVSTLPVLLEGISDHVARRAAFLSLAASVPIAESVARRKRREHARVCEYFSALIAETRGRPGRGRRADPAAVAAKTAHFVAERDAKLRDLEVRFRLRVSLSPAAFIIAAVPAASVRLRLRRRKSERELILRMPSGARSLDAPACDGCPGEAVRPVLCDERLHLLCERCVPSAEGRPQCPACRGPRSSAHSKVLDQHAEQSQKIGVGGIREAMVDEKAIRETPRSIGRGR